MNYIQSDPESSLAKSRTVLEKILIDSYTREMEFAPKAKTIEKIIGQSQFNQKIPKRIVTRIRTVQSMGNIGVHHDDEVTQKDAEDTLEILVVIFEWYLMKYDLVLEIK
ncbi:MAG: DUF4145 domain-containing protein, partial [Flavobacteriales bacterium]|nr:DUF4145 domain-containing protein [Flavobacteriales bacterium]